MYTNCGETISDVWPRWLDRASAKIRGITFGNVEGGIHAVDSLINGYQNPPTLPGGFTILPQ